MRDMPVLCMRTVLASDVGGGRCLYACGYLRMGACIMRVYLCMHYAYVCAGACEYTLAGAYSSYVGACVLVRVFCAGVFACLRLHCVCVNVCVSMYACFRMCSCVLRA